MANMSVCRKTSSLRVPLLVLFLALVCLAHSSSSSSNNRRKPYDHRAYKNNDDKYHYHQPQRYKPYGFPPLIPYPGQNRYAYQNGRKPANKPYKPDRYDQNGAKPLCRAILPGHRDHDYSHEKKWMKLYDKILNQQQRKYISDCYYDNDHDYDYGNYHDHDDSDHYPQQKYESVDHMDYDYDKPGNRPPDPKPYSDDPYGLVPKNVGSSPFKPGIKSNEHHYDDQYYEPNDKQPFGSGEEYDTPPRPKYPQYADHNVAMMGSPSTVNRNQPQYMSYYSMPRFYPEHSTTTSTTTTTQPPPPSQFSNNRLYDIGLQMSRANGYQMYAASDPIGIPFLNQMPHSAGSMNNQPAAMRSELTNSNNRSISVTDYTGNMINSTNCNCTTIAPAI